MANDKAILEETLDLEEASKLTGYKKNTLYWKSSKGEIPCFNTGKNLRFFRGELMEWMKSFKKKTKAELATEISSETQA